MIEAEGQEDGFLEMPDPAAVNLTALMLEEQRGREGALGAGEDGIVDLAEPGGRVKDGLLESFLQSNFPDEEVRVHVSFVWMGACGHKKYKCSTQQKTNPLYTQKKTHKHRCSPSPRRSGARSAARSLGGRPAGPSRCVSTYTYTNL